MIERITGLPDKDAVLAVIFRLDPHVLAGTGVRTPSSHNVIGERMTLTFDFDSGVLTASHPAGRNFADVESESPPSPQVRRAMSKAFPRSAHRQDFAMRSIARGVPLAVAWLAMLLPLPLSHQDERERALTVALLYQRALETGCWPRQAFHKLYDVAPYGSTLDRWISDARHERFLKEPNARRDRPAHIGEPVVPVFIVD